MNENEILDNPNIEDINIDVESDDFIEDGTEEILDTTSVDDDLNLDILDSEELTIEDDSLEENIDNLEETISEDEEDTDFNEDLESIEKMIDESTENEDVSVQEDAAIDNVDFSEEEEELVSEIEEDILDDENSSEEIDITLQEESPTEETEIIDEINDQIEEESADLNKEEPIIEDENFITNDLDNINIEFGIEAKGFILSLKMMEAMIEKGYIFKDILNDKVFDAVMIFNGNLENTVMTNDIKIKIEDGKIQLIKG